MYIVLTLFFISLLGIISMIGYKLSLARNGNLIFKKELEVDLPEFNEIKKFTHRGFRRYSFIFLVMIIRLYVKLTYFLKNQAKKVQVAFIELLEKRSNKSGKLDKREASGFLRMVAEYKSKIRNIKYRIVIEEEELRK